MYNTGQRERLSEVDIKMYKIYWIKRSEHTDIYSQGYVGITKDFDNRIKAHKKNRKKTPLTDAIKTYGFDNLEIDIVDYADCLEDALKIEAKYRPDQGIGWNLQKGGELGVEPEWYNNPENSAKHSKATSLATKAGIAAKDSREARSQRAKDIWERDKDSRIDWSIGEKNGKAKLKESQVREARYELIPQGFSDKEIAEMFGVKSYVISFIRKGKTWRHV